MRLLVLGGTAFVGYAVAAEALRRGHSVVCAARGTKPVPVGATLVKVDRDADDGLAPLTGEFDAVVDVATMSYPWVADAVRDLGDRVGHWTFVSTVNVYRDNATPGQTPATGPLREPFARQATREELETEENASDLYGSIKVASENAVRDAMGDRAFVVRPGLITGTGDRSDRFGYWPGRFARGGRVLVPDVDQPMQIIDVQDLARWIVNATEQGLAGTYDGIGPHRPLAEMLTEIAEVVRFDGEVVGATPEQLGEAKVNPWAGPRSLPLWLPPEYDGMKSHDATPSIDAGMPVRPFAEAVADALAHERALGLDRERKAGLSQTEEAEVLANL